MQNKNEQKFYEILENLFIGAKISPKNNENGFICLLRAKSDYFSHFRKKFETLINEKTKNNSEFKEEIYDKLYDFFHRYFNESGALLYERTPAFYNLFTDAYTAKMPYEQVKSTKNDTELFYKTKDLYYVKSEKIYNDLAILLDGIKYEFDASNLKMKKSNEKQKELDFLLTECENLFGEIQDENALKNGVIKFSVSNASSKMSDAKITDILKELKKANLNVSENELKKAFKIYEKQSNIDFFINKNAKEFLSRQLDLWIYQYLFTQTADFKEQRIKQISDFKEIALNLINFISAFENELCKIWLKPRFVINSNFVVSLSTLKKRGFDMSKLKTAKGYESQEDEWRELSLKSEDLLENENLAIDTKYFPEFKDEISKLLENSLDGTLIKSENFGALNSIKNRFKNSVDLIYIDPPYNTGNDGFEYLDNFNHASWLSMMSDRLKIARANLNEGGVIFVQCDDNEQAYLKVLCDEIFNGGGGNNFINSIAVLSSTPSGVKTTHREKTIIKTKDYILIYAKNANNIKLKPQYSKKQRWDTHYNSIFYKDTLTYRNLVEVMIENNVLDKGSTIDDINIYNKKHRKFYLKYADFIFRTSATMPQEQKEISRQNPDKVIPYFDSNGNEQYALNGNRISFLNKSIKKVFIGSSLEFDMANLLCDFWFDIDFNNTQNQGGVSFTSAKKPEQLIYRIVDMTTNENDLVMDFFAGSGTTLATAHKMGRKWLGVEMGEHFDTVILPRMKKVLSGEQGGISKAANFSGGGCFKYYELESYEQILRNIKFSPVPKDAENLRESEQDCFLFDEKLSRAYDENLALNLKNLGDEYANIDLKESFLNYGIKEFDTLNDEKIMQILRNFLVW
ncbi:site-specific DNA-methyltransferase [Campylobacter hyointestinalis]|uniref:site-specific DNA-methyltransferase n=1 Tax=Campylobacter hyointestinalis TaxID=198 RepID=UPI000DCAFB79|nr:site-specific DNA-methyltransferase [Campylobacter hyointestinalis]RAZ48292.1 site-specific DNA-methyltransferase [Campylobacter hyointestinalis subsp. lawsonii]